jgi:predicted Zn-dependent peptidase
MTTSSELTYPYLIHRFPNGIRLVHRQTDNPVAHLGVIVNAGSRDELPHEQGMAHFIEHMIFKGTRHRTAYQVITRLEDVGADLNAFTTKEETCIYASFLPEFYSRALELLSDILFESTFPEKEMVKEKAVIIDEINSYKDNPAEWIHDEFDELIFPDHPLGKNILGTPHHLKSFQQSNVRDFISRLYLTDQMVISSAGNISFDRMRVLAEKYFGSRNARSGGPERKVPPAYVSRAESLKKSRHQAHLILGNRAYNYHDPRRVPMALLNNLIGGPAMNSRLNLALRERNGIAYNVESNYQPLSDTGLFTIYLGTDNLMLPKAMQIVRKELDSLMNIRLSDGRLGRAKEQLKGQLAISMESHQNEVVTIGKSLIAYDHIDTREEIFSKIDQVGSVTLLEIANEVFDKNALSMLLYRSRM